MTQKIKPTNRQQQQEMHPALARAEKKLNKQINKQMTTITYSNNRERERARQTDGRRSKTEYTDPCDAHSENKTKQNR